MNYNQFISLFRQQLANLSYTKQIDFALAVCNKLYIDYQKFVEVHNWGNPDLLMTAIKLCELNRIDNVDRKKIEAMLPEIEAIAPDMDDFGDNVSSYALNTAGAVYETLEFLIDHDIEHIYNVGICLTDNVDFKVQEDGAITEDEIESHPMMLEAWEYIIQLSK
ncbi:DUF416 family protein [Mucilaginibacter lutimaris]|uniref:DUF416 family protein n=1 Tax=Mucilaginibacter lutimaris TaxID=931629 RepID=A0ABW2ZG30_9SPHI